MPFPCYPFSPLRFRGGPSKKHFVELSAYLIKCNMDMSWLTCRLTYCAMSRPPPATRPPSPWPSLAPCPLAHGVSPSMSFGQRALLSNVKFDINKCLHNDSHNLRNCHRHPRQQTMDADAPRVPSYRWCSKKPPLGNVQTEGGILVLVAPCRRGVCMPLTYGFTLPKLLYTKLELFASTD